MASYKLNYFDFGGRAMVARLLLNFAGVEFTDHIIKGEEWPTVKNDTSKFPMNQIPTLEANGQVICQSRAINNFLANEFGLYGSNNMERAVTDQLCDTLSEISELIIPALFEDTMEKRAEKVKATLSQDKVKTKYNFISNMLKSKSDGKQFLLGEKITVADITFYVTHLLINLMVPQSLDGYGDLKALFNRIQSNEKIHKCMEKTTPWYIFKN